MKYIKWIGHGRSKLLTTASIYPELWQVFELLCVFGKLFVKLLFVFRHLTLILLPFRLIVRFFLIADLFSCAANNIG